MKQIYKHPLMLLAVAFVAWRLAQGAMAKPDTATPAASKRYNPREWV